VHESNFDEYRDAFVATAEKFGVGNGLDEGTQMGPTANNRRIAALTEMVDDARAKGAEVLTSSERLGNIGCFFKSTVLANVPGDALIMREEPFGPIAILNTVASLDDVVP